ncbi:hypothetical protein NQ314_002355 [Rhamnusium bicolor]|uniref:DDE-1 domain-containing protein n=1 Tax=Rhamnusium bicolor TaxID=1586634 RepID=A0AAV8ZQD6_9CUCU|nr:hypothetical protein NQ314_002355 [Rhamnusium bicolor]
MVRTSVFELVHKLFYSRNFKIRWSQVTFLDGHNSHVSLELIDAAAKKKYRNILFACPYIASCIAIRCWCIQSRKGILEGNTLKLL